jgi:ribokinase
VTDADLPPVCVVGNLNTDLILRGVPALPDWGTEAVGTGSATFPAGQAGYLALGLRRLDVPTHVIGAVGSDPAGERISGALSATGADTGGIEVIPGGRTGITVAVVRPDGERAFISDFGCGNEVDETVVHRGWEHVDACAVMCLVGLFNLTSLHLGAATDLVAKAHDQGCTTVLDPGWDPGGWPAETISGFMRLLEEVDVFLPNSDEAAAISGSTDPETASAFLQEAGPSTVVVKCGAEGSYGRHEDQTHHVSAIPVPVADAVGAGDAFDAAFIRARLAGDGLAASMDFANTAAGLYVSRPDDRFPSLLQIVSASGLIQGAPSS